MSFNNNPLIVTYSIGDGYTFTAERVVPVMAQSKEAFMEAFDLAMAAYEPDGVKHFSLFGQVFEYLDFIHWGEVQWTKRRVKQTYDSIRPTLQTVDEWVASCQYHSEQFSKERNAKVFVVTESVSPKP